MEKSFKKNKKVTIDDLAIMIAKGFENTVTKYEFIELSKKVDSVEKRFDSLDKKVDKLDQNIQATRRDVLEIGDRFVSRNEFDNLLIRFNNLEKKVKEKF